MFSNRDLRRLLIPLIAEQVLTSLMGTVDTMMVSQVGSEAVSGVSLVDTINKLMLFLFTALATGGAIVCAQYLGRRDKAHSNQAGQQVLLTAFFFGVAVMALCLLGRKWMLHVIFGQVEQAVMEAAERYFLVTAFSYPFIALFNASAALYRATGNTRLPMVVSVCSNLLNVIGNALLLFVFHMGVAGAALSTVISFALAAVVMLLFQRRPNQLIEVGRLTSLRPNWRVMALVLSIGLPTGIENAMFQFGKIMVQSTVSTLGTTAIAANAIVTVLEYMSSMPATAIGTGLMTVAGQCIGAGRLDEAKANTKKLTLWGAGALLAADLIILALTVPVTHLAGLDSEAAAMTFHVMLVISIVKPFLWPLSFLPINGMRADGDVKFGMVVSTASMWIFRVGLTYVLCRVLSVGLVGIWCGYFADWFVRSILFSLRYVSGKWTRHQVIEPE
ncbi:MAG: MATE family efflux transporter [Oscillospiraceae bacterium]|nr:MATE family efflux transporter [Oscillospiraceae bacterium]